MTAPLDLDAPTKEQIASLRMQCATLIDKYDDAPLRLPPRFALALLDRLELLEGIVRDVAAKPAPIYDGMHCMLCGARGRTGDGDTDPPIDLGDHKPGCPWRRAREAGR
jgi:hypothetical protein